MLQSIFATKLGMTQVWDKTGKRWAVTKCKVSENVILGKQDPRTENTNPMYLIGFGKKKLKNMNKPLKKIVEKSGFSFGVKQIRGVAATADSETTPEVGSVVTAEQVLHVGDIVKVQGTSKGRGFAGAMKRYGFHGGPRTHGQSDRARAVGSIGSGTTPGRVWKGKKMPGHYGVETKTVTGLIVLHIDEANQEVWLSGPVPGSRTSVIKISPVGKSKQVELDTKASGISIKVEEPAQAEPTQEKVEEKTEQPKSEKVEPKVTKEKKESEKVKKETK